MWRSLFGFFLILSWGNAQQVGVPTEDLGDLQVEELLSLKVTSVGRKAQRIAKAPAAVFVMTQEDIRRSGATTVMDVLRMVPGMAVGRIAGSTWAISSRGGASQFANKMLVLVDGRSVYSQFFSGVIWDQQDVMLENIERIEVIRGPGAVMWGANAVNGVINIITYPASATQGGLVRGQVGTEDRAAAAIRFGGALANGAAPYRVYAKFDDRVEAKDGATAVDQFATPIGRLRGAFWNMGRAGFRLDWDRSERDSFTAEGDFYASALDQGTRIPSLVPPYGTVDQGRVSPLGVNFLGRWTRKESERQESALQVYYDYTNAEVPFASYQRHTGDVDFQNRRQVTESHEIYWGLGLRYSADDTSTLRQFFSLIPASRGELLAGAVIRDEWQLRPERWTLSAGIRVEHDTYAGFDAQPSVRLLYTPDRSHSFWAAWSRAVRTPDRVENDMRVLGTVDPSGPLPVGVFSVGNSSLRPEIVRSYELGYRQQAGQRWSVDAALFYSQYRDIDVYVPQTPNFVIGPLPHIEVNAVNQNRGYGNNSGGEIWAAWNLTPRWRLIPGYSLLFWNNGCHDCKALVPPEARHRFYFRSLWDVSHKVQFDAATYTASALAGVPVPKYARFDARFAWRPNRKLEVSVAVEDLFNPSRREFLPTIPYLGINVGRAATLRVTRRF